MIDWFDQEELSISSVIVVGAGAIGNEVIKNLCLLGLGNIHVIDFDKIEIHNLTRSVLFNENHIGRYKAEVAAEIGRQLSPETKITYSIEDFWNSLSIKRISDSNAVFCCVDNFEARLKLNKLCLIAQTDFYNAGIDSRFVCVEKYPFDGEFGCACYECNLPSSVYTKIGERYSCGWLKKKASKEEKIPTTIITASIAGGGVSSLFLQRQHSDSILGAVRCFTDTITLRSTITQLDRQEDCITCSSIYCDRQYLKVKRTFSNDLFGDLEIPEDIEVFFSDLLILDIECKQCGKKQEINDRAENYDDSLVYCSNCRIKSNEINFCESMSIKALSKRFSNIRLPVKYLFFNKNQQLFILELED
jgi:molybdopterin/thiamine biosynthesis adenylyltransferase